MAKKYSHNMLIMLKCTLIKSSIVYLNKEYISCIDVHLIHASYHVKSAIFKVNFVKVCVTDFIDYSVLPYKHWITWHNMPKCSAELWTLLISH